MIVDLYGNLYNLVSDRFNYRLITAQITPSGDPGGLRKSLK
jgi:hypothetical protein